VRPRLLVTVAAAACAATALPAAATLNAPSGNGPLGLARDAAPVVLTGAQIPAWSAPPAEGIAQPQPSGASSDNPLGDEARTAHNGRLVVPPTPPGVTQVDPAAVAAYSYVDGGWQQIPVQVDQRFPYFLANGRSGFGFYSGTDEELTYAWGSDSADPALAHDTGEESWKKMFDTPDGCSSAFATSVQQVEAAHAAGWLSYGPEETAASYLSSMQDPQPLFDGDDELSFMAGDAGGQALPGTPPPAGTANGQAVTVTDPLDPTDVRYVYLFTQPGGSQFNADNGYVHLTRDPGSTDWIDRHAFTDSDPMKIGTSNTGYGPNLPGTVCHTAATAADGTAYDDTTARESTDRQPRDSFSVSTDVYHLHATGRWLIQGLQVATPRPTAPATSKGKALGLNKTAAIADTEYGQNIIARWKGRAFQQSPDSSVSLVGFEDEQVNWELNSALLGWRNGPVRAIREIWGADSGTNVTKTEYYYRTADSYAFHVRVHPIPPDGLYTDWSYRPGVATTYYNVVQQNGVPIDGRPDTSVNEIDQLPTGQNAYVNSCDPKFTVCSALDNPEEVAGPGFELVYEFELTGPTAAAGNIAAVPYYRDDACFDDGTGDAPVQRPWPGEASTDPRVQQGYVDYWAARGMPTTGDLATDYAQLKCQPDKVGDPSTPAWQQMPFSGAIGEHGIHFFVTQDSDNAFGPKNVDEIDGQQWRYEVSTDTPRNDTVSYGANVSAKLVATAAPYTG
jgi:hypothetical protein